jgi:acyl carrier protein
LNGVAKVAKPAHSEFSEIQSMDEKFSSLNLDSLDMLMIGVFIAIIYGIEDEVAKNLHPTNAQEMLDFVNQHKTCDPESIESALELIK